MRLEKKTKTIEMQKLHHTETAVEQQSTLRISFAYVNSIPFADMWYVQHKIKQRMTDQKQVLTLLKTLHQEVAGVKSELKALNLKVSGISMQVISELY